LVRAIARLRVFEFSTATLGEKKANVKQEVVFALRSPRYRGNSENDIHMNMPTQRESLPAVTVAGIVAILFSSFGALGCLMGAVGLLLMPDLPTSKAGPAMPPNFKMAMVVMLLIFLAIAVFGIIVAIGVFRRRNWARICILVWGGIMAFFSACAIPFVFLAFSTIPAGLPADVDAGPMMSWMKWFSALFYGIPLCVGIWWLILFTRKRVAAAFTNSDAPFVPPSELDASGFPLVDAPAQSPRKPKPACPLPVAIVAVFFIFSAVCMCLVMIVPMPATMPVLFFGHVYYGAAPKAVFGVLGVITGVAGFGLLKLKPWALYTELVLQSVFLVNGVITILSPNYGPLMREVMEKMSVQYPAYPGGNPFATDSFFRITMIFSMLFVVAILAVLLFQRSRFLDAAAAAKA
jgi:uncharacterized membrane protein (DUF2068 family)